MIKRTLALMFLTITLSIDAHAFKAKATTLTTVDIVTSFSTDRSCLNYCITGICVWLRCSITGCRVRTSLKVRHNNPDLVVSVYDQPGENPWREAEALLGAVEAHTTARLVGLFHQAQAGGGHRIESGHPGTDHSLRFKEVTAIGHPVSAIADVLGNTGFYCPSEATALVPYLSSGFDALSWRLGLPEMLYLHNLLPGRRVVGSGFQQQWGSVWPRTGFINQKDDVKAAAVIAQRAGNIVTKPRQPHVYRPLNGNGFNRTWLPGELIENRPDTGVWQMLAPKEDRQCYAFGENDVFRRAWSHGRQSEDKRYAFALWRPYECCADRGSYLFTVPMSICL